MGDEGEPPPPSPNRHSLLFIGPSRGDNARLRGRL